MRKSIIMSGILLIVCFLLASCDSGANEMEIDVDSANAHVSRGTFYFDQGDMAQAIAEYDSAIGLDPDNALAYYNRGSAHFNNGDLERSIADYDQVLELNPDFSGAYNFRGYAYYVKDDRDRAIADFHVFLKMTSDPLGRLILMLYVGGVPRKNWKSLGRPLNYGLFS